jgi:hypothetical protein
MQTMEKRKSIIHALNVFLVNPISIYLVRESSKYIIGYEPKRYRIHSLLYKISKELVSSFQFNIVNEIGFSTAIDINIREDYRNSIKANNPIWHIKEKNVVVRIIPTRHADLQPVYGIIYQFGWRHTGGGGRDILRFKIKECSMIVNANNVENVCYKLISTQTSAGGTHGLHTYLILAKDHGKYEIGEWIKASNWNKSGHRNVYVNPVTITL